MKFFNRILIICIFLFCLAFILGFVLIKNHSNTKNIEFTTVFPIIPQLHQEIIDNLPEPSISKLYYPNIFSTESKKELDFLTELITLPDNQFLPPEETLLIVNESPVLIYSKYFDINIDKHRQPLLQIDNLILPLSFHYRRPAPGHISKTIEQKRGVYLNYPPFPSRAAAHNEYIYNYLKDQFKDDPSKMTLLKQIYTQINDSLLYYCYHYPSDINTSKRIVRQYF